MCVRVCMEWSECLRQNVCVHECVRMRLCVHACLHEAISRVCCRLIASGTAKKKASPLTWPGSFASFQGDSHSASAISVSAAAPLNANGSSGSANC